MATLQDGIDDGTGYSQTPGSSYAIFPTALQKAAQMHIYPQDARFEGSAHQNDISEAHAIPIQRQLIQVEIHAKGDAPSGASLVVQVVFKGMAQSPTFSLDAGQTRSVTNASGDNLVVLANQTCAVQIVTPSGAADVVVKLLFQLVIL
jgi:hypothetical protein